MPTSSNKSSQSKSQTKQEERYSWWSWRRSRSSRETTPVVENADTKNECKDEQLIVAETEEQGEIKDQEKQTETPEDCE